MESEESEGEERHLIRVKSEGERGERGRGAKTLAALSASAATDLVCALRRMSARRSERRRGG